jgi:CheY-like chemotaxis protein
MTVPLEILMAEDSERKKENASAAAVGMDDLLAKPTDASPSWAAVEKVDVRGSLALSNASCAATAD